MAVGSRRAAQSRERAGAGEAEARAALGAGGEGVHLRHGRGTKTLAELFDGRSQVLARNIMFGPDYTVGACPGCSNLADHLDAAVVHLNHRDVTLLGFSRAPLSELQAYKERMGWRFPYISTSGSDFPFDFGLALT